MEIKKYVLLDNIIYGKSINEFGNYYLKDIKPNDYCGLMRGGCNITHHEFITTYNEEDFKTSDNILAFAEENDFIEYIRKSGGVDRYFIKNAIVVELENGAIQDGHGIHQFDDEYNEKMYLYKKQPNGDYKRYEVEE